MKVIIMMITANYAYSIGREDLVKLFNDGEHIVDNDNELNSYSILNV